LSGVRGIIPGTGGRLFKPKAVVRSRTVDNVESAPPRMILRGTERRSDGASSPVSGGSPETENARQRLRGDENAFSSRLEPTFEP
jgi:hypothetical protein